MAKIRILIVEDEFIVAEDIKVHLLNFGYDVVGTVNTAEKVLEKTRELKPNIVLMDITLQGEIAGIDAADQVRIHCNIPVIYLTAYAQQEIIELAKKTGPYGYLTKPIDYDYLQRTIDIALYKHEMEDKLKSSEERFKKISSSAYDGVILINNEGNITFWNSAAEKIFGYSAKEGLNKNLHDLISTSKQYDTFDRIFSKFKTAGGENVVGEVLELEGIQKDRSKIAIELSLSSFKEKDSWNAVGIIRDITERKLIEEKQKMLSTALEQSAELIIITDSRGNIQFVNPAFEQITGYKNDEVVGKNPSFLKSGKQENDFYKNLWETISAGNVWKGRFVNKKKDGSFYDEMATISPITNSNGEIVNYIALKRDITNEIKLEHHLRQSQKMQTIGTLAGGIAHDFNNILSPLFGYTEMLLQDVDEGSQIHSAIEQIFKAALRAKDLVHQILTFSRQGESERKPFYVHHIVKEIIQLLKASLPATIQITRNINSNCGMVLADPTQIHQIIMNLCTNASYAMGEKGGTMEIKLDSVEFDASTAKQFGNLSEGTYIRTSVSDTGHGMEKDVVDRIFEPFFTTKPVGEGTGLGLSVAHGIVKDHGGTIIVESKPGIGSTFRFFLPVAPEDVQEKILVKKKISNGNNEHILLVDDEESVTEMLESMLERMGYNVTSISNSLQALQTFRNAPQAFDVVISDQTMPDMSGVQLSKELLNIRPDIPIILCTGYSDSISQEKTIEMGINGFIEKPFLQNDISVIIRQALNKES
ncbi:PAS domain S-box protein [candidate division KSB1 bacterium]|nr:PAS domain S-box protein [candidate division KSB1 bacterium]